MCNHKDNQHQIFQYDTRCLGFDLEIRRANPDEYDLISNLFGRIAGAYGFGHMLIGIEQNDKVVIEIENETKKEK